MIPAKEIDGELWVRAADCQQAITEAVAQENEACALIADKAEPYKAADLIRKRVRK